MKKVIFNATLAFIAFIGLVLCAISLFNELIADKLYLPRITAIMVSAVITADLSGYFTGCTARHIEELKKHKNPRVE